MMIEQQSVGHAPRWQLESLPGDGLVASSTNHVLVVEVDDGSAATGFADEIVAAFDAHNRLVGRGASRMLRQAISTVVAEHETTACAVALVSTWDENVALYLHGHASATFRRGCSSTTLDGSDSLVATDLVLPSRPDQLQICVGGQTTSPAAPVEIGEITVGTAVRVTWIDRARGASPLNEWKPPR